MGVQREGKSGGDVDRPTTAIDAALQALLDKQACAEVMMTYCRAIDRCDETLLRSAFHPDSYHRHGFSGPSSDPSRPTAPGKPGDFVAFALGVLATHTHTHHQLGNVFIELESDGVTAFTEAYFTAYHRMRAKGDPLAGADAFDTEMDLWVGGRYLDRMEKRDGVWKIAYRVGTTDWMRIEPPSSRGLANVDPDLRSRQSRDDMVYRRRAEFRRPNESVGAGQPSRRIDPR